jgi:hypothetical protein
MTDRLLDGTRRSSAGEAAKKWLPSLFLGAFGAYLVSTRGEYTYIDAFLLIVHEAGHVILSFFGETIHMLGGTIMQIVIPVLLIIVFLISRRRILLQAMLMLLAQSFLNISVYVEDAPVRKLKLFGPPGAKHDWHTLLTKYGILEYSEHIATGFTVLAVLTLIIMFFVPRLLKDI